MFYIILRKVQLLLENTVNINCKAVLQHWISTIMSAELHFVHVGRVILKKKTPSTSESY